MRNWVRGWAKVREIHWSVNILGMRLVEYLGKREGAILDERFSDVTFIHSQLLRPEKGLVYCVMNKFQVGKTPL